MEKFLAKYQRRIDRFRSLANYKGKVFFLRSAYWGSVSDPHRCYRIVENLEITDEAALKLHDALRKRFPNLDFTLVIINTHDRRAPVIEGYLTSHIIKTRVTPALDVPDKIEAYRKLFTEVLASEGVSI